MGHAEYSQLLTWFTPEPIIRVIREMVGQPSKYRLGLRDVCLYVTCLPEHDLNCVCTER